MRVGAVCEVAGVRLSHIGGINPFFPTAIDFAVSVLPFPSLATGYKMAKYNRAIEIVDSFARIAGGNGGYTIGMPARKDYCVRF